MPETQDPYLELATAALAAPEPEDPYLALATAALADEGAGIGDYAAAPVRGLMESVIGPLSGLAGMGEAFARAHPSLRNSQQAPISEEVRSLRRFEPDIHPEAEQSLTGQLLEGAGNVAGIVGQSILVPGSGLVKGVAAGGAMGSTEFGRGQERALAAGASPADADLAGLLDFPAGAIQAIGPGRAAAVLSRAWKPFIASLGTSALKEGGINALTGAVANGYTEFVHQAITGQEDVQAIFDAVKRGVVPDLLIGGLLGGAMRWSASRAGPLSPEGLASVDAAAQEAASTLGKPKAQDGVPESAEAAGEPTTGVDEAPRPTLIEEPDEPTSQAVGRFREALKLKEDQALEVHEAPEPERARAAEMGARVIEVDGGDGLKADGYYDRATQTIVLNRRAGPAERKRALLDHEFTHFMEREHPKLAQEWKEALDEVAPGWAGKLAEKRVARHKELKLPVLSKEMAAEEGRAESAEGLGNVLAAFDANPDLVEAVARYKPGLIRAIIDATIDFANKLKLTSKKSIATKVRELQAFLDKEGSGLERSLGAQKASELAVKLRELHRAMRVEAPAEQPKANIRSYDEEVGPQPAYDEPIGPERRAAEALATRKAMKDGMAPEEAATALDVIDRRLEDALTGGESPDSPRIGELKKDRATAVRLLYEGDPAHKALSKESPVDLWARIVKEDEAATQRREQKRVAREKAVGKATEKLESDIAREKAQAEERRRAVMDRVVKEERAKNAQRIKDEKAEREADEQKRKDELKTLREDIKGRAKRETKPGRAKPKAADPKKDKGDLEDLNRRIAESKARAAAEEAASPKPEAPEAPKPVEPPKVKLPVARLEQVQREELSDPHIRSELERMMQTAGWETEGGKAFLQGTARNERGDRGTTKWIPKDIWFKEIPDELKMNAADAKHAISSALRGRSLGAKQRAFVEWAIDRADRELYQGATGEERAAGRRAYDEMVAKKTAPPTVDDIPDSDAPFALPRETREERIERLASSEADSTVSREEILKVLRAGGRIAAASDRTTESMKRDLRFVVQMGLKGLPPDPFLESGKAVRLRAIARLFAEQEARVTQQTADEIAAIPPFQPTESARRKAYAAERRAQQGWLDTFQKAARKGATDAEAAGEANAAHPAALEPSRFLGGLEDEAFAVPPEGSRDGAGIQDFLRRWANPETHYAVTTDARVTNQLRSAAEQFWEKETRTIAQAERAAREMLATAAGKAEVDAAIRGERAGDWREQSDLTLAAETRVNNLLRAAKQGTTDAKKAVGIAVDYFMLRSEQGRALRVVQRPRTPSESFYAEIAHPAEKNAIALRKLQNQLRVATTKADKAQIRERIAEIKALEAKRLEQGMLALKKAGIDPDRIRTSAEAAKAFKVFNIPTKTWMDWALEFRVSSMVSAPSSSIAALGGNVMNVGWNTVLLRLAELPVPKGASVGELRAMRAALPGAFTRATRAFLEVWKNDTPSYEAGLRDKGLIADAQVFENAKLTSIPGRTGRIVRGPGLTAMTSVDEFARALGSELEAVGIAYRRSKGDRAKMRELLAHPSTWEEAVKRTRRSIFQERENNPLVELGFKARELLDKTGGDVVPVGNLVFPFVQTGVNGLLEGLRKLPGPAQAIALFHGINGEWKGNPELRARDAAAQILSIGIASSVWALANMEDENGTPYITGTIPADRGERSLAWRTAPPMSFRWGDQWYSYAKLMPFAAVFATVVDAAQDGVSFTGLGRSILRQGIDTTYLRSLAAILNAVESDTPPDEAWAKGARDFAASFVPNIAASGLRALDDGRRPDPMRKQDGKSGLDVGEGVLARIGLGRNELDVDNFGRVMDKGGSALERYISPVAPTANIRDLHAADRVVIAYNRQLAEGEKPQFLSDAPYWYKSRGETHYLTGDQFSAFKRRAGELASSMLDESTLDPEKPTLAQISRIKLVLSRARARARREILRDIPIDEEDE